MKMVWPTVWPGAAIAVDAGQEFLAVLDEHEAVRTGSRFLRAWITKSFSGPPSLPSSVQKSKSLCAM